MHYLNQTQAQSECPVALDQITASGLSYELGVDGEKTLMDTEILLIEMDIADFTLVDLKILAI